MILRREHVSFQPLLYSPFTFSKCESIFFSFILQIISNIFFLYSTETINMRTKFVFINMKECSRSITDYFRSEFLQHHAILLETKFRNVIKLVFRIDVPFSSRFFFWLLYFSLDKMIYFTTFSFPLLSNFLSETSEGSFLEWVIFSIFDNNVVVMSVSFMPLTFHFNRNDTIFCSIQKKSRE